MRVERIKKLYIFGSVPNARLRIESYVARLNSSARTHTDLLSTTGLNCDVTTLHSVSLTTDDNVNKNIILTQQSYAPKHRWTMDWQFNRTNQRDYISARASSRVFFHKHVHTYFNNREVYDKMRETDNKLSFFENKCFIWEVFVFTQIRFRNTTRCSLMNCAVQDVPDFVWVVVHVMRNVNLTFTMKICNLRCN